MRRTSAVLGIAVSMCAAGTAFAQTKVGSGEAIAFLIGRVGTSGCTFVRNGAEHASQEAADHLRRKLAATRRELTVEQFIEHIASKSSMSGRPYTIRCDGRPEETAGDWLRRALHERG